MGAPEKSSSDSITSWLSSSRPSSDSPTKSRMAVKDIFKNRPTPYTSVTAVSPSRSPVAADRSPARQALPFSLGSPRNMSSFASRLSRFRLSESPTSSPTRSMSVDLNRDDDDDRSSVDSSSPVVTRKLRERKPRQPIQFSDDSDEDQEDNVFMEAPADDDSDDQAIGPARPRRKRRHIADSDEDMDDDDDDDEEYQEYVDDSTKNERAHEASTACDKAVMLRSIFPHISLDAITRVLRSTNGSVVLASQLLARNPSLAATSPEGASPDRPRPRKRLLRRQIDLSSDSEEEEIRTPASYDPVAALGEARKTAQTVRFYNNATSQEIQDVTGCKPEQAERLITKLRPFVDMEDLREKLRQERGLSEKFISAYVDMMDGYSAVDQIIEEIEHVGGNLRKIIDVWEDLQKRSQSADSSRQGTPSSDDAVDESAGTHLVELPFATDAVADVNSDVYRDAMDGFLTQQPNYVSKTMQLNNYQILGVNWMLLLYRKGLSGILADEMGLGKTAQVISFLGRLYEMGEKGPHLVIVPASTIENWMREFQRFCPKLHVVGYYGTQAERVYLRDDLLESRDYQVVVTTYTMATGAREDRSFLRRLGCKSMILDEGHMIKNCTSSRYTHLMSLRTPFRLLLTGTPLQNNLQELVSLLTFIMPDMFLGNEEEIRKIFKIKAMATTSSRQRHDSKHSDTGNIAQVLSRQRIARAKKMMTPFVLRRRKADVLKHLPQKFQVIERCPMTALQKEMYDRILKESQRSYKESLDAKADKAKAKAAAAAAKRATSSQFEKFSNIVIHLRKAADHPLLFRNLYTDSKIRTMAKKIMKEEQYWDANEEYIYEDMSVMSDFELQRLCKEHKSIQSYALNNEEWMDSGKVQKLKELLPDLIQKGSKVLLFSQFTRMLDILELVMDTLGMKYVRLDGETKVADRQPLIDEFNENDDIHVFLLSTKAGGFGINLTSANVVILYDMDFNPQNDKQAEDRAHRVGQTRDVTVIKLIADRTIEDAILKMAEIKLRLDRSVSGLGDDDEDEDERKESVHTLLKSALLTSA